jgi:hypothetical protein
MMASASRLGVMLAARKVDDEFLPSVISLSCSQIEFEPEWLGFA